MLDPLVFIRDALIAVLLSWVGIEVNNKDKPAEDAPESAASSISVSVGRVR